MVSVPSHQLILSELLSVVSQAEKSLQALGTYLAEENGLSS